MKCVLAAIAVLLAACPMNTVVGQGDTTSGTTSTGAASTTGGAGGQSSGGQSATSTGGSGTRASGGGSGGTSGDGGCGSFGSVCRGNSECCSGACNGTCGQPAGQMCYASDDCSSDHCVDGVCACDDSACAVDKDCCLYYQVCQQNTLSDPEVGQCCSPTGSGCALSGDGGGYISCCAGAAACVNDVCQCLPPQTQCQSDVDCCEGKCKSFPFEGLGVGNCASSAGDACSTGQDCLSFNCIDGGCADCAEPNGSCASDSDCCGGLVCANFEPTYQSTPSIPISFGLNCCVPNGLACEFGMDCCSEVCDGGCTCVPTSGECFTDRGCCAEGACMPRVTNAGALACCQMDDEGCIVDGDCCSGSCQNEKCACVAAGGKCGVPGEVAPEGAQACCSGQCSGAGACL